MAIDLDAAVAAYWSGMRVGVTDGDVLAAWTAAAHAVWKDELYVESGLNLGWALHTRTLDATWGDGWLNPSFGQEAVRSWSDFERLRQGEGRA